MLSLESAGDHAPPCGAAQKKALANEIPPVSPTPYPSASRGPAAQARIAHSSQLLVIEALRPEVRPQAPLERLEQVELQGHCLGDGHPVAPQLRQHGGQQVLVGQALGDLAGEVDGGEVDGGEPLDRAGVVQVGLRDGHLSRQQTRDTDQQERSILNRTARAQWLAWLLPSSKRGRHNKLLNVCAKWWQQLLLP